MDANTTGPCPACGARYLQACSSAVCAWEKAPTEQQTADDRLRAIIREEIMRALSHLPCIPLKDPG